MRGSPRAIAESAAREAGTLLRDNLHRAVVVETKGRADFVTGLDLRANDLIRARLGAAFPDHRFLTEETVNAPLGDEPTWVVDPVDGTLNLVHGFPYIAVSLALVVRGEVAVGVVCDPLGDELFTAAAGEGAACNGGPISVDGGADPSSALVAFDLAHDEEAARDSMELASALRPRVAALRLAGSAALALCHVAAGRLGGFFHHRLEPWDMAAAMRIVREAGGCVTDFEGRPVTRPRTGPLVAGHAPIVDQIHRAEQERRQASGPGGQAGPEVE
ncbi:MAG: inositol monophosphatase family protein [Gemmatimonadaceae bacterium]|nr:inositol monophosphatase family protein [Gemmatimonadaceae bacterium]